MRAVIVLILLLSTHSAQADATVANQIDYDKRWILNAGSYIVDFRCPDMRDAVPHAQRTESRLCRGMDKTEWFFRNGLIDEIHESRAYETEPLKLRAIRRRSDTKRSFTSGQEKTALRFLAVCSSPALPQYLAFVAENRKHIDDYRAQGRCNPEPEEQEVKQPTVTETLAKLEADAKALAAQSDPLLQQRLNEDMTIPASVVQFECPDMKADRSEAVYRVAHACGGFGLKHRWVFSKGRLEERYLEAKMSRSEPLSEVAVQTLRRSDPAPQLISLQAAEKYALETLKVCASPNVSRYFALVAEARTALDAIEKQGWPGCH